MKSPYGCPFHPQSETWPRVIEAIRDRGEIYTCSICGTPFSQELRELLNQQKPEPVTVRSFGVYREHASRTDGEHPLAYYSGGLCEEAGEVWGVLKKTLWHGHPLNRDKLREELGDCLWVLDQLCKHLGFALEEVATANICKLQKRYGEKFSQEASRNREAAK